MRRDSSLRTRAFRKRALKSLSPPLPLAPQRVTSRSPKAVASPTAGVYDPTGELSRRLQALEAAAEVCNGVNEAPTSLRCAMRQLHALHQKRRL